MLAHPQFIALHLVGRSVHLYLMDLTFRKILSKASFPWEGEGQRAGTQSARVTGRRWLWGTAVYVYCLVGFWVSGPPMAQARWQAQCVSGEVLSRVPVETFVYAPFKHWLSQHFNSEMELWNACLALVWVTTLCVPWHIPAQEYFFFSLTFISVKLGLAERDEFLASFWYRSALVQDARATTLKERRDECRTTKGP